MELSSQRLCRLISLPLVVLCLSGANPKPGDVTLQEGVSYRAEGRQLQEIGDLHRALAAYRMAIAVHPGYAEAYNDLAVVLESVGRTAEAEEAYQRALRLKPELAAAHSNLALLYEAQGRIKEAGEHWVNRIRLGPAENPWVVTARERLLHHNLPVPPEPSAVPAKPRVQKRVKVKGPSEEVRLRKAQEEAEKAEKRRVKAQEEAEKRRVKEIEAARARLARQELAGPAREQKAKPVAPKPSVVVRERAPAPAPALTGAGTAPSEASKLAQQVAQEKGRLRQKTTQELYQRGLTALRGGRYDEAAQSFRQILTLDPNHRDAQQGLERAEKAKAKAAR